MTTLNIDGVGRVEIGNEFLSLSPERQAAEVEAIAAQARPKAAVPAPAPAPAAAAPTGSEFGEQADRAAAIQNRKPDEVVDRATFLPMGKTAEGNITLAIPGFIQGPMQTIADIMSGKKTSQDISGQEMFELGGLFAGISAATGTGKGIASSARARAGAPAEAAAPEAPAAAPVSAAAATIPEAPATAAPAAVPPVAAPVAEAAAAPAMRGGLHSTAETLALRGEAKTSAKVLDESNVVLNPQSFKAVTQEIFSDAAMKGLDETITPASTAAVKRLQAVADEPITLQSLNTLREVANGAAGSRIPKDRMIAERIIEKLDDYVGNLKAKDIILGSEGDAKAVAEAVKNLRGTWAEMSKLELVARLVQRAKDAEAQRPALGLENTLRNEFTQLAKNDKEMRRLSPEERNAVRQITRGATKTTMRSLGRLAPTGPVSGAVTGGLAIGLGAKIGLDPMASMIVIGAPAFAARKLAAVLTQRSVKNLENVIKSRNDPAALAALERGRALSDQMGSSLTVSATTQATQQDVKQRKATLRRVAEVLSPIQIAHAMDIGKRNRNIPDATPRRAGEGGGGKFTKQEAEMEKALEQIRKENAGLTREQRRERDRKAMQEEFDKVQDMSDSEWNAALDEMQNILRSGRKK